MRIFWEKTVKIVSASGALPSDPRAFIPPTITTLTSSFLVLNAFYSAKKEPNNYSKCSAFAYFALLHLYFCLNSVSFVEGGRKNIPCPRAQGTQATPLSALEILLRVVE